MNVYDFDNTIYDGESLIDFFLFSIKKRKSLIKYLPLIFYTASLYKLRLLPIEKLYKLAGKMSSAIIDNKENAEMFIRDFWNENFSKLKPYYLNKLKSGDVIISASPRILIEGILNKLKTNNLVCSELDLETGTFDFVCFKENKALAFKKKYPNVTIDEFYTDSLNDISLIELSKKAYLVKKRKIPKQIK